MTPEQIAAITALSNATAALDAAKLAAENARTNVARLCFAEVGEGSKTLPLGGGYKLSYSYERNYSIPKDRLTACMEQLNLAELHAERARIFKPSVSVSKTALKNAEGKLREVLAPFLSITDTVPTVKLIPPADNT